MDPEQPAEEPIDPVDAQLLALLDGELDVDARGELEKKLVEDRGLRQRLRVLQRSWEMLNDLPHKTVDHRFASTTVEVVVKRATQELEALPLPTAAGRRGRWILVGSSVLAIVLGFVAVSLYRSWDYRKQLADLAVAEHLEGLLKIDQADLPFLKQLVESEAWNAHVQHGMDLGNLRFDNGPSISSVGLSERTKELRNLTETARSRLELSWDDWQLLDAATQESIRQEYSAIVAMDRGHEMLRAADLYAAWLRQLSDLKEKNTILATEPSERLAKMEPMFAELQRRWENKAAEDALRPVLMQAIERWEKNSDALRQQLGLDQWLAERERRGFDGRRDWTMDESFKTNPRATFIFIGERLFSDRDGREGREGFARQLMKVFLTPQEYSSVATHLPSDDDALRQLILRTWMSIFWRTDKPFMDKYLSLVSEDPELKAEIDLMNPWEGLLRLSPAGGRKGDRGSWGGRGGPGGGPNGQGGPAPMDGPGGPGGPGGPDRFNGPPPRPPQDGPFPFPSPDGPRPNGPMPANPFSPPSGRP